MTAQQSAGYRTGETVLLAAVPEAEPQVCEWRRRFDPSAAAGVPPHITVLYPFLDLERIDGDVLVDLRTLIGRHAGFDVRFERCGRFPGVLYLAPVPDRPLRGLTDALVERWPEAPPYAGRFDEVVPHLSVAVDVTSSVLDEIEEALAAGLPLAARVSSVQLFGFDGTRWEQREEFALTR